MIFISIASEIGGKSENDGSKCITVTPFHSLDSAIEKVWRITPTKRSSSQNNKKRSIYNKKGGHTRTNTSSGYLPTPKQLFEMRSNNSSEPTDEVRYFNMKIRELEGSLEDKDLSLLHLNIDYNKIVNYRRQYEKLRDQCKDYK
jgi:hypothetical protein